MIQTLMKNWWLLAICGLLEAAYSVFNLSMLDTDRFATIVTVAFLGRIALAAGIGAIAAGIWNSRHGTSWLLVLHGLALTVFGLISVMWSRGGRLRFLPVALLFVVMAGSIAWLAWSMAPGLRRHLSDKWSLAVAGFVCAGFAVGFLITGFGWVRFDRPGSYFLWMSSYFGFSAICMLALGLRLNSLRSGVRRIAGRVLPA